MSKPSRPADVRQSRKTGPFVNPILLTKVHRGYNLVLGWEIAAVRLKAIAGNWVGVCAMVEIIGVSGGQCRGPAMLSLERGSRAVKVEKKCGVDKKASVAMSVD